MGSQIISVQLFPHHIYQNGISVLFVGILFSASFLFLKVVLRYFGSHSVQKNHIEENFGLGGMIGG